MLSQLCILFLLYVPFTRPVSVQIDGSIDVAQNFDIKFTPGPNLMRTDLPAEVSAILDSITRTTASPPTFKHKQSAVLRNKKGKKAKKKSKKNNVTKVQATEDVKPFINRRKSNDMQLIQPINDETNQQRRRRRPKYKTYVDNEFIPKMKARNEVRYLLQKTKNPQFITEKTYNPNIVRITRQMDLEGNVNANHKKRKKKKGDSIRDATKRVSNRNNDESRNTDESYIPSSVTKNSLIGRIGNKKRHKRTKTTALDVGMDIEQENQMSAVLESVRLLKLLEKYGIIITTESLTTVTPAIKQATRMIHDKYYEPLRQIHVKEDTEDDDYRATQKIHLVKTDPRIQNFTLNVFQQNIHVLDTIQNKVNNSKIKMKIDLLARSYRNKFGDFVKENQNQKIVTNLGTQKVVLNTIETSSRIMRRLLNFLVGDMEKKGILRSNDGVALLWKNRVETEEHQEYVQACQKFNICRSKYAFSNFVSDFFTILLQVDDAKLKQGIDAFTEVAKYTDLVDMMEKELQRRFRSNIFVMEQAEPAVLRPVLWMFRNMLISKNQPLVVQERVPKKIITQSVALMDLVNMLDDRIPATEENLMQWNVLRNSLVQWANGQRRDILEIMQAFFNVVVDKGVKGMSPSNAANFQEKLKMFLRAPAFNFE